MFMRKFILWIIKNYNSNPKKLLGLSALVALVFSGAAFLLDYFMPFNTWHQIIAALMIVPPATSFFIIGYCISITLHERQVMRNPNWVPYRQRLSVAWRQRIAIIIAALIIVITYAVGYSITYTFVMSIFLAIIIALIAYIRTTRKEQALEDFGLPDTRDLKYKKFLDQKEEERNIKEQENKDKKSLKRYNRWGVKDKNFTEDLEDKE